MKICYIAPVKETSSVMLYSSALPMVVAPAIVVLNNILKITISIGWALIILQLIQTLLRLARSGNKETFVNELKKIAMASVLMWMLPHLALFVDVVADGLRDVMISSLGLN